MHRCLIAVMLCVAVDAVAEDRTIAALFAQAGVEGTLVIESVATGERFVHNDVRSTRPYIAASTFKVLNTLIAVEEGVIAGPQARIPWDGTRYEIDAWNRDQTLQTAFRVSCVWCYQALARRIGAETYRAAIREVGYGTLQAPFDVDRFWLDGALTISAEGQVRFLMQVVQRTLPFRRSTYDTLERVMRVGETADARLYAKTGWSTRTRPGVGWYLGYLETTDATRVFALNLDTRSAGDLPLRERLVLDALDAKGLLPAGLGR